MDYQRPDRIGYTVLPVLEFLTGEPWDDRILDFIHAVRPSTIRIALPRDLLTCDAVPWRVTVMLDQNNYVKRIEQEVEVGLRTADNGHCLMHKIPKGDWPTGRGIAIVNTRAIKGIQ
jgi:hypothetical protein